MLIPMFFRVFSSKSILSFREKITRKDNTGSIFHKLLLFIPLLDGLLLYSRQARSSAPDFGLKYAGAISNTVLHPVCPSDARR